MSAYSSCVYYSAECPPAATVYGYIPNLGANIFFDTWFGLAFIFQIALLAIPPRINGTRTRHWAFGAFTIVGTCLSFLGGLGRIWIEGDFWVKPAIGVELTCNLVAGALLVCALYCILGRCVKSSAHQNRLFSFKTLLLWFGATNTIAIILQVVGGAVATSKGPAIDSSVGSPGLYAAFVGVIVQVGTMLFATALVYQYIRHRGKKQSHVSDGAVEAKQDQMNDDNDTTSPETCETPRVKSFFLVCLTLAWFCVLIRSIYRIAEFAGGWGNVVMRNEASFMVLDYALIAIAWTCLTIAHPSFMTI